jgi:hypothetical protein
MIFKLVADSSANTFAMSGVSFASVPMKIITTQAEYVDDPALDVAAMVDAIKVTKGKTVTHIDSSRSVVASMPFCHSNTKICRSRSSFLLREG